MAQKMQISNFLVEKYKTMYLKEIKIFKHSFHIFLNLINIPNVYVHVNYMSFTGVHMDVVGLQWQNCFDPRFQFAINVSQQNFEKEKLLINS